MSQRTPSPPGIARADFIEGLARGLAVLEAFDTSRQRLNASQAAARTGLTRAAARRHLLTLAHLGYLQGEDGDYWLSPKVLRLSGSYLASSRLPRAMQPIIDALALRSGLAHSVAVLDGGEVVVVARSIPAQPRARIFAHGIHLGARLPVHATSTGKLLLACLPATARREWFAAHARTLPRLTPGTVATATQLQAQLKTIAAAQYCLARGEHEPGVHAIAVPVADAQGRVVAALNAVAVGAGPGARLDTMLPALREAAAAARPLVA